MTREKIVLSIIALGLVWAVHGCANTTTSTQRWIEQKDHAALANHYAQEAQSFREKAKHWMDVAEFYEKHPAEATGKMGAAEHAAHCRAIAENYQKAAAEADALVTEHRRQLPHGMIQ
jgi:hypothetical protein